MDKFLSPELISKCFDRLSAREPGGKKHLERTSALLYFLAFDAACKHLDTKILDLTPGTLTGVKHRRQFEIEFIRLSLLSETPKSLRKVIELGKVELDGAHPKQRISSNFFSVQVKNASNLDDVCLYPNRPPAPVFSMGKVSTGIPWGITRYEQWNSNFQTLLSEVMQSTPNIDLAIFAIRDIPVAQDSKDIFSAINSSLKSKFTVDLCNHFSDKIKREKMFADHIEKPFSDQYKPFMDVHGNGLTDEKIYNSMKKEELIQRIIQLENIIKSNNITI